MSHEPSDQQDGAVTPATPDIQNYLGDQLRAMYDDLVNEPVPDRFVQLLEALEKSGPAQPASAKAADDQQ